jgi:anhydro-N-acetylmuramic acid kinase
MKTFQLIGLMSGTSIDGLDIAHVAFHLDKNNKISFQALNCETISYTDELLELLRTATELSSFQLMELDIQLGKYFGEAVNNFLKKNKIEKSKIDAIASHGHTIFHQPNLGLTTQIGNGQQIASTTCIKTINNFREKDVINGGQGAPLVPIGDFDLFSDKADSFLNIGGFSNVSFKRKNEIIAYDICPGNLPLNKLATNKGLKFDKNGYLAKTGEINFFLLDLLNNLEYYNLNPPKSLGTEWLEQVFYPLIKFDKDIENNLRTIVEHISYQIANELNKNELKNVMISGGGVHNIFLIERIQHYFNGLIIIPEKNIIDFKEAIVFAYLGLKKLNNETNCLASVTGARNNVSGGVIYEP